MRYCAILLVVALGCSNEGTEYRTLAELAKEHDCLYSDLSRVRTAKAFRPHAVLVEREGPWSVRHHELFTPKQQRALIRVWRRTESSLDYRVRKLDERLDLIERNCEPSRRRSRWGCPTRSTTKEKLK